MRSTWSSTRSGSRSSRCSDALCRSVRSISLLLTDATWLFLGDLDGDVAGLHAAGVIALYVEGAGFAFVGIERAARGAGDLLVIDSLDAVANHRQPTAHQSDVEAFPLARRARQLHRRREHAVDTPDAVKLVVGVHLLVLHLDFVAAAQIDAAIAVIGAVEFDVQFEIVELARGFQVGALGFVDQLAVLHRPVIGQSRVGGFPSGEILAVEDWLGGGPRLRRIALEQRRAHAGEIPEHAGAALFDAGEFAAFEVEIPGDGGVVPLQAEVGTLHLELLGIERAAGTRLDADRWSAVLQADLHPVGIDFGVGGFGSDHEVPSPGERIGFLGNGRCQGRRGEQANKAEWFHVSLSLSKSLPWPPAPFRSTPLPLPAAPRPPPPYSGHGRPRAGAAAG